MPTLRSADHDAVAERDRRPGDQAQREGDHRRDQERDAAGARRNDGFLEHQLQAVGDRLQQAPGADHVRAAAHLHRRHHLALGIGEIGDRQQQRQHDCQRSATRMMKVGQPYEDQKSTMSAGPRHRRHEGVGAFRHGLGCAADRIGHVVVRDRQVERARRRPRRWRRSSPTSPAPRRPAAAGSARP